MVLFKARVLIDFFKAAVSNLPCAFLPLPPSLPGDKGSAGRLEKTPGVPTTHPLRSGEMRSIGC